VGCDRGLGGKGPLTDVGDLEDFGIVRKLLEDPFFRQIPNFNCAVSGGEPTLYTRLPELVAVLKKPMVLFTNGLLLLSTPDSVLQAFTRIAITVYSATEAHFTKNYDAYYALRAFTDINFHKAEKFQDLNNVGTERLIANGRPLACIKATVVGNIERIFPCCRALTFERMTGNCYSVDVASYSFKALQTIALESDMCKHCPRLYLSPRL
jgi:hypothetical protein